MITQITPRLIELTYEAALKSFWRRESLRKFLRASHVSDRFLAARDINESKRELLDEVFKKLQITDKGKNIICEMAKNLSKQNTFPDLRNWEDSNVKIVDAAKAVSELKSYLWTQEQEIQNEREREEARKRAREERQRIQRSLTDLSKLQRRIDALQASVGTAQGGYDFQDWFYSLLDFYEIQNRRPYMSSGRQIDGSLTLDGTTYLVELKFTANQADATDIDSLRSKVDDKADNTMGIMVSISGYSKVAIKGASGRKTTLLLFDHTHLYLCLSGVLSFGDIILRVRRHVSQTSDAYLSVSEFGG